ncbi:hypothetical protein WMY93_012512 [Mugilogobius chulae]|uniref:DRBM domain-containing protein n=1 Tax=Mugilogobius chulae TaxID=88201 RepID=A0AAW0P8V5_9GOBI
MLDSQTYRFPKVLIQPSFKTHAFLSSEQFKENFYKPKLFDICTHRAVLQPNTALLPDIATPQKNIMSTASNKNHLTQVNDLATKHHLSLTFGNTKKEARARAASNILQPLKQMCLSLQNNNQAPVREISKNTLLCSRNPQDVPIPMNRKQTFSEGLQPCGCLSEVVQARGMKYPEYTLLESKRLPWGWLFTMKVSLPGASAVGTGPTKKAAKNNAAAQLLQILGFQCPKYNPLLEKQDSNRPSQDSSTSSEVCSDNKVEVPEPTKTETNQGNKPESVTEECRPSTDLEVMDEAEMNPQTKEEIPVSEKEHRQSEEIPVSEEECQHKEEEIQASDEQEQTEEIQTLEEESQHLEAEIQSPEEELEQTEEIQHSEEIQPPQEEKEDLEQTDDEIQASEEEIEYTEEIQLSEEQTEQTGEFQASEEQEQTAEIELSEEDLEQTEEIQSSEEETEYAEEIQPTEEILSSEVIQVLFQQEEDPTLVFVSLSEVPLQTDLEECECETQDQTLSLYDAEVFNQSQDMTTPECDQECSPEQPEVFHQVDTGSEEQSETQCEEAQVTDLISLSQVFCNIQMAQRSRVCSTEQEEHNSPPQILDGPPVSHFLIQALVRKLTQKSYINSEDQGKIVNLLLEQTKERILNQDIPISVHNMRAVAKAAAKDLMKEIKLQKMPLKAEDEVFQEAMLKHLNTASATSCLGPKREDYLVSSVL